MEAWTNKSHNFFSLAQNRSLLTFLGLQSRFGDKYMEFDRSVPKNWAAVLTVLKGLSVSGIIVVDLLWVLGPQSIIYCTGNYLFWSCGVELNYVCKGHVA